MPRAGSGESRAGGSTSTPEGPWEPFDANGLRSALAGAGALWWVAGGHAIDLALGRETRPHGDVDIAVLRRDQRAFFDCLAGWDLRYVLDGRLEPWEGEALELPVHGIWARNPAGAWAFELLLQEADGEDWLYRRDPRVRRPLAALAGPASALPALAPEIVLLYKAKGTRPRDEADLRAVLPRLSGDARSWLAAAVSTAHPGHPWLAVLG